MKNSITIGAVDDTINYTERPTVKALIFNLENNILIINNGLLPGGGLNEHEDSELGLSREVLEELGMKIAIEKELGRVTQYRDFLKKKYTIHGYKTSYLGTTSPPKPQDDGEARFTYDWYSIEDATQLLKDSIRVAAIKTGGDSEQGKLYNLKTTQFFINLYIEDSKIIR